MITNIQVITINAITPQNSRPLYEIFHVLRSCFIFLEKKKKQIPRVPANSEMQPASHISVVSSSSIFNLIAPRISFILSPGLSTLNEPGAHRPLVLFRYRNNGPTTKRNPSYSDHKTENRKIKNDGSFIPNYQMKFNCSVFFSSLL